MIENISASPLTSMSNLDNLPGSSPDTALSMSLEQFKSANTSYVVVENDAAQQALSEGRNISTVKKQNIIISNAYYKVQVYDENNKLAEKLIAPGQAVNFETIQPPAGSRHKPVTVGTYVKSADLTEKFTLYMPNHEVDGSMIKSIVRNATSQLGKYDDLVAKTQIPDGFARHLDNYDIVFIFSKLGEWKEELDPLSLSNGVQDSQIAFYEKYNKKPPNIDDIDNPFDPNDGPKKPKGPGLGGHEIGFDSPEVMKNNNGNRFDISNPQDGINLNKLSSMKSAVFNISKKIPLVSIAVAGGAYSLGATPQQVAEMSVPLLEAYNKYQAGDNMGALKSTMDEFGGVVTVSEVLSSEIESYKRETSDFNLTEYSGYFSLDNSSNSEAVRLLQAGFMENSEGKYLVREQAIRGLHASNDQMVTNITNMLVAGADPFDLVYKFNAQFDDYETGEHMLAGLANYAKENDRPFSGMMYFVLATNQMSIELGLSDKPKNTAEAMGVWNSYMATHMTDGEVEFKN